MPGFNGAGVFERTYDWTDDQAAAIKIRADRMDTEMDGFATGLSNCICRDGQSTLTANLPMSNRKLTGLAAGSSAGDSVRYEQVVLLSAAAEQLITRTSVGIGLTVESTEAGAARAPDLAIYRNSASPADADVGGGLLFDGKDSGGTRTTYARIYTIFDDVTSPEEDGTLVFSVVTAGTLADELWLRGASFTPATDGGAQLGASSRQWDGLYLSSGTPISWASGDVTLTHSSGVLTASGGLYSGTTGSPVPAAGVNCFQGHKTGSASVALAYYNLFSASSGELYVQFAKENSTSLGTITVNSGATGIDITVTSDGRLKKDDTAIEGSGAIIDALRPKKFKWQNDAEDEGLIAQEVYTVYPRAVIRGDDDLSKQNARPWSLKLGAFDALIISELQDLRRRVAALE